MENVGGGVVVHFFLEALGRRFEGDGDGSGGVS